MNVFLLLLLIAGVTAVLFVLTVARGARRAQFVSILSGFLLFLTLTCGGVGLYGLNQVYGRSVEQWQEVADEQARIISLRNLSQASDMQLARLDEINQEIGQLDRALGWPVLSDYLFLSPTAMERINRLEIRQ
jgi:hypothetical protein